MRMLPFVNSEMDFPGGLPVEGMLLADVLNAGPIASGIGIPLRSRDRGGDG
jgi:hypothetical protein